MIIIFFFYLLVTTSNAQPSQNSSEICQKCACSKSDNAPTFTMDCSDQKVTKMIESWPSQDQTIRAIFTKNTISSLDKLPPTNSSLEIVLSKCNITSLADGVFSAVPNTKLVDLSYNLLEAVEVTSDKFKGPVEDNRPQSLAVEDLDLAYNQIHSLNKDVFEFLPNLKRLNLEGNDFAVLDAHTQLALASIPGLTSLNLANNELTELIPNAIEQLSKLTELDLSKNQLDFVPYSLEKVGKTLQRLILDENPIFEMTTETFKGLVSVNEISANNLTKLKHIDAGTFVPTEKLTKLSLFNCSLQIIDSKAFAPNSTLKELRLSNNNLTKIPPDLLDWSQLEDLRLEDNPLECSCALYTVASALSPSVTRNSDPTCADPAAPPRPIYSLSSDICEAKQSRDREAIVHRRFSVPLAGLVTILIVGLFVAMSLAQQRYRRFVRRRRSDDPFVSQVIYSPLLNARA